jgi:D-alanine-D-alanine ligase
VTPAEVDKSVSDHIQEVSAQLYDLLDCRGIVRFDFIYDTQKQELFFLEVNTIPGQSAESIVPKQARAMGISTAQLYEMIIEDALEG